MLAPAILGFAPAAARAVIPAEAGIQTGHHPPMRNASRMIRERMRSLLAHARVCGRESSKHRSGAPHAPPSLAMSPACRDRVNPANRNAVERLSAQHDLDRVGRAPPTMGLLWAVTIRWCQVQVLHGELHDQVQVAVMIDVSE